MAGFLFNRTRTIEAREFIAEGQAVYLGSDGKVYSVDPNAPKSLQEAQERRIETRLNWIKQFVDYEPLATKDTLHE